eukprot:2138001-Pyramimonas_sp.AAC.1
MRTAPLEPSVELPMGPWSAVLGEGDACELRHCDLGWASLCGMKRCAGRERRVPTAPLGPS